jgi:hypothetical protein
MDWTGLAKDRDQWRARVNTLLHSLKVLNRELLMYFFEISHIMYYNRFGQVFMTYLTHY